MSRLKSLEMKGKPVGPTAGPGSTTNTLCCEGPPALSASTHERQRILVALVEPPPGKLKLAGKPQTVTRQLASRLLVPVFEKPVDQARNHSSAAVDVGPWRRNPLGGGVVGDQSHEGTPCSSERPAADPLPARLFCNAT